MRTHRKSPAFWSLLAVVLALVALGGHTALAATAFFQGFETDNSGWNICMTGSEFGGCIPDNNASRVASGTNGITARTGAYFGEALGPQPLSGGYGSAVTFWGGYNSAFASDGFYTQVDIWLDPAGLAAVPTANDTRFDWDSAASKLDGSFDRDFVFNGGYYNDSDTTGTGPRFVFTASNNAGRSNSFPKNPARSPYSIATSGWYTFKHRFYITGGVLAVDLTISNSSGTVLHTWTLSDPSDVVANCCGNRYGWFASQEFPYLAFDNSQLVTASPAFTSAASTVFAEGQSGSFTVTASGNPAPTLSESNTDTLPGGVTFTPATGVLSGTPTAGSAGSYTLHFTASNGVAPVATQVFTLTVTTKTIVVVTPGSLAKSQADVQARPTSWFFYNDENDTIDNSLGSFVTGPATPPLGTHSVQISVTGTQRRNLATYQFSGVHLADITTLRFSTYNPSAGNGGGANRSGYLNFNVDFNDSDTFQHRLTYLPANNATITPDTWKEWDAINGGNALWTYSGATWPTATAGPDAGVTGVSGNTVRTWSAILADYPGIRILVTDSWLGIRVGEPYNNGYTEDMDAFKFGTASGTTWFDFNVLPPTVTGVTPSSGPPAGGTNVTITGTGFTGATAVNFGANPATYTVTDDSDIAATSPAGSSGPVHVTVTTLGGTSTTSAADQFTYGTAPAFNSAAGANFTVGQNGSFTVTASGSPTPTLSESNTDTLPGGVTFTPATGVLSGTPNPGTSGSYTLHFTASNGVSPDATQTFMLLVAGSGTMAIAPASGSHAVGDVFTVLLTLSAGQSFNAASATVSVSANLSVEGVNTAPAASNPCPVATYPVIARPANPSFSATFNPPQTACAMYQLTLRVVGGGNGTITISNGSIKAASDGSELFGSAINGSFTLTGGSTQAPAFTSANSTSFTVGQNGSFTVTASGNPTPTLSESNTDTLPGGVTFTPATGVLSGTPNPGTSGSYTLHFTASNGVSPDATQVFTLTVNPAAAPQAPSFTSANSTSFTVGQHGSFTVTASGNPTPTLSESNTDTLPGGVTFTPATGVLSGTPNPGTNGSYTLHFTASNGVSPDATQVFTLTVNPAAAGGSGMMAIAPASGSHAVGDVFTVLLTLSAGQSFNAASATVSVSANLSVEGVNTAPAASNPCPVATYPVIARPANPSFSATFNPPQTACAMYQLTLRVVGGGNGTITISNGSIKAASDGSELFGSAINGSFTLTGGSTQAPAFTSANSTSFTVGQNGSFTVTASGNPTPTLSESNTDTLPGGVTFTPATGVLSGTPNPGTSGSYTLHFTASNGVSPDATQVFTLTVNPAAAPQAPSFTSANSTSFTVGQHGSFTVTASGNPTPTLSESNTDTLPGGVTFTPATGVLSGTPNPGTNGSYTLHFTASNGVSPDATQVFTLTVNPAAAGGSGMMAIAPASGSHAVGDVFTVLLTLSAGQSFNAASATVSVSANLSVEGVNTAPAASNPCPVATYPVIARPANPSFSATFNPPQTACAMYQLTLRVVGGGNGTITISNGSIKAASDGSELFGSAINGSFTVTDGTDVVDSAEASVVPSTTDSELNLATAGTGSLTTILSERRIDRQVDSIPGELDDPRTQFQA